MTQHIKADIIYYNTPTDFEMEFNLCGCCRIRLLTEKAPDKKTLGAALGRAVSRSKIIIIVGNLFSDNGTLSLVSSATGIPLSPIKNEDYGISSDDVINIPKNAVPLITQEGVFGGCLLVSGPQTMILLSDSKSTRKTVMSSLVHPYITELAASKEEVNISVTEEDIENEDTDEVEEEIVSIEEVDNDEIESNEVEPDEIETDEEHQEEIPEGITEKITEEIVEEINEQPQEEQVKDFFAEQISLEDEIVLSDGMEYEAEDSSVKIYHDQDDGFDLFIDSDEIPTHNLKRLNSYYSDFEGVESDLVIENDNPTAKKGFSLNIFITVISILLLIVVAVLCYCIFYVPSQDGVSVSQNIKDIFTTLFG